MNIRKMGGGRAACMSIAVGVVAALAFLIYTPRAASQAGQAPQGAQGAPAAQAGRGGRGGGGGGFTHAAAADYNDEAGFTSLFNGDNLDGWTSDGQNWSVKDGAIYAQSTCEHPTGTIYIYSDIGLAGNFDLKVRMKGTEVVNSGIQYRSWLAADLDAPHSPGRVSQAAAERPAAGPEEQRDEVGLLAGEVQVSRVADPQGLARAASLAEHRLTVRWSQSTTWVVRSMTLTTVITIPASSTSRLLGAASLRGPVKS